MAAVDNTFLATSAITVPVSVYAGVRTDVPALYAARNRDGRRKQRRREDGASNGLQPA